MARWICEQCNQEYIRDKSGNRQYRFCSQKCYLVWRKENNITTGQFAPGFSPWNKDLKGIHLSPQSEFKKGRANTESQPIGTVRIRTNHKTGKQRAWVKVAEPNVWRFRCWVVWEKHHGPIPKGKLIHHKDRDTLNDAIDNLELLTRAEHLAEHRAEFEEKRLININKARAQL